MPHARTDSHKTEVLHSAPTNLTSDGPRYAFIFSFHFYSFLYSIIASATIFLAYLFFSFPGFPLTFYYIWNFLDNFYMEIVLKNILRIELISCMIKDCVRNLPDNIFIQFVLKVVLYKLFEKRLYL